MNIILLGYMGSGKSAIGKLLAEMVSLKFIDLDDYIESKEGITVSEIFASKGEIYFRKIEHQYLKEVLGINENAVISLGGGTPCYSGNMEIIKKHNAPSFYLKASIQTIHSRLQNETNKRPIVSELDHEKLQEFIAKHLFERRYFYEQADKVISVDNKSLEEIVDEILISK